MLAEPDSPSLSVVVPAYNEAVRLGESLPRITAYLDERGIDGEIVVVNDGSRDATARIAAELLRGRAARVLNNLENRGKGHSVRRGVLESAGSWLLLTDADLSTPITEHARLADAARRQSADLVIGSRGLPQSRIEVRQNLLRETMGKTFNWIMRSITGLPFKDTQCGFKLMKTERVRPLFERMVVDRFAFDVELLCLCLHHGLSVCELPVIWRNSEESKVSLLGDPLNMLWDVARVGWRLRRGLYDPGGNES